MTVISQADEMLTTKQAAAMLGVSRWWLERRRSVIGGGPRWFKVGDKAVYKRRDVDNFLEKCVRNGNGKAA